MKEEKKFRKSKDKNLTFLQRFDIISISNEK